MKTCPICGTGSLERKAVPQTFEYKGRSFQYEQPGDWCNSCGEGILENSDMDTTEPILYDFRAKVDGYLTTSEVRRIRKKLSLTQKQAGEIFGGGHNAFSRYERGAARQPKSLDLLLRMLDRNPDQLHELTRSGAEAA